MSPRKRKAASESSVQMTGETSVETQDETPVDELEGGMFDVKGGGPERVVRCSRWMDAGAEWVLHGRFIPQEFTAEKIAELFGGGRYKAVLFQRNERGVFVYENQRTFNVPGSYKPPREVYGLPTTVATPAVAGNSPVTAAGAAPLPAVEGRMSPAEMISSLQVQQLIDISSAGRKAAPAVDYTPLILKGMEVVMAFLSRPKETEGVEVLRVELQQLREQMRQDANKPGPAVTGITDLVQVIESVVGLRDVLSGDGGGKKDEGESALYGLAGKLLETMGNKSPTPTPMPTGQPGATIGTIPSPTPVTTMPIWQQVLQRHARDMVNAAMRNVDPELAADYTAAMIPSEVEGAILEFLARPDADKVLIQVIPQMAQFESWTTAFINALRLAFTPETGQPE